MSKLGIAVGGMAMVAISGQALALDLTAGAVDSTKAALTSGLVSMDLTSHVTNAALLTTPNTYEYSFTDGIGLTVGSIKTEIFANQSAPGLGVNDVLLVLTMTSNGLTPLQFFEFGINTGVSLDFADIAGAQHGRVVDEITAGQTTPSVDLFDNVGSNDTLKYDYAAQGDPLSGTTAEQFTWYMRFSGAVTLDFVQVTVEDGIPLTAQALLPVSGTGQDDLNTPTPGVLGAFAGAGLLGLRRRR